MSCPARRTFRSFGAPCEIVELRVPAADLLCPIGLDRGPLELPTRVWDAYHELARARSEAAVRRLIEALGEARILSPSVTASVVPDEPERFVRVWSVLEPLYGNLATSTSLKQVAAIARLLAAPARPRPPRLHDHVQPLRRRLPRRDARAPPARRGDPALGPRLHAERRRPHRRLRQPRRDGPRVPRRPPSPPRASSRRPSAIAISGARGARGPAGPVGPAGIDRVAQPVAEEVQRRGPSPPSPRPARSTARDRRRAGSLPR